MKVNIVCYEDVNAWILGKFARKLQDELVKKSIQVAISKHTDPEADINHHIIYVDYDGVKSTIDTIMITHIDTLQKLNMLKKQLKSAEMGICMSRKTMQMLVNAGLPAEKLCYINPAHDGVIKPRPVKIGITSKIQPDGRKKESLLLELTKYIKPEDFEFVIMGEGWHDIVNIIKSRGFFINYFEKFDYDKYIELVPTFDYFFYFSDDEGSMGFIDALAAGVPTIVTPQGYHLDAEGGITYPVQNFNDIRYVFDEIAEKKRKLVRSVEEWTWENYAKAHIEIWSSLIDKQKNLASCRTETSIMGFANGEVNPKWSSRFGLKIHLLQGTWRDFRYMVKNDGYLVLIKKVLKKCFSKIRFDKSY